MSRNYTSAGALLKTFSSEDQAEKNIISRLYAKQYMLMGQPKKALAYLTNITAPAPFGEFEYAPEKELQARQYFMDSYTGARIKALTGENAKALNELKILLSSGFNYQYVLNTDPAWDPVRKTKKWIVMMNSHEFTKTYVESESSNASTNYNTVLYRIPMLNKRFTYN